VVAKVSSGTKTDSGSGIRDVGHYIAFALGVGMAFAFLVGAITVLVAANVSRGKAADRIAAHAEP
jgi:hypothetical protein